MLLEEPFMTVNKGLMRSSEDQPKVNSSSDVHVWHTLWHALGDITGKAGPISREASSTFRYTDFFAGKSQ